MTRFTWFSCKKLQLLHLSNKASNYARAIYKASNLRIIDPKVVFSLSIRLNLNFTYLSWFPSNPNMYVSWILHLTIRTDKEQRELVMKNTLQYHILKSIPYFAFLKPIFTCLKLVNFFFFSKSCNCVYLLLTLRAAFTLACLNNIRKEGNFNN